MIRTLVRLEIVQMLRSRAVIAGMLLILAAGAFAIDHGRRAIERQRGAIAQADALQREQHAAVLDVIPPTATAGDQAYYLRFLTENVPSAWAPVSIGQRDMQAFNLKVRLLAIHGQLYDSDLANPLLVAFGNFDLAFVLVFLTPLLVIALTYNVWSADQELGTWDLLRSQPTSVRIVMAVKLAVRTSAMLVPAVGLMVMAALWLHLPLDWRLAGVAGVTLAYVGIWIGAAVLVVALGRSSDFNLVALLALWLVWVVLGPALVTVAASVRFPASESLEIAVRQRQGYHSAWDRPVRQTMALFYERYPQWRHVPVPEDRYSNAWYYGMQHRGDAEAEPAARRWRATLQARERWTMRGLLLFPPALFQRALNAMAGTDLQSHLAYLDSVIAYHEALKEWLFPAIFDNRTVAEMDWSSAPRHEHVAAPRQDAFVAGSANLLAIAAALIGGAGLVLARRLTPGESLRTRQLEPAQTSGVSVDPAVNGVATRRAGRSSGSHEA